MLADAAVAVHPDDGRYHSLLGHEVRLPLVGRHIPIIADSCVDPKTGSGAVKITPAHDFNDFEVGRRHHLPLINIMNESGQLNAAVPTAYASLDRYEARLKVVSDLQALGLIERIESHQHTVPHGDRSGVAIEPRLTDQWYVKAEVLAQAAVKAVETGRTVFVPKKWENTYFEWMRNIQPWCISRQLWWGHQIPAWYGPDGSVFVEETEDAALAAAEAQLGIGVKLVRDSDVLDTWFSSALWPFSTLGWPDEDKESLKLYERYYPGDVLITGFDIIFFWVARMMMMGLHFQNEVPFRTIYVHALIRDGHGRKMSKTTGNVVDPLDLIDKYGTDALRLTLTSLAVQGRDIQLSLQRIENSRNFATKLWNAARYCQLNECYPLPCFDPLVCNQPLNRWIAGSLIDTATEVDRALVTYRFNEAAVALHQFTRTVFCDWYLEFTKSILDSDDDQSKTETRATAGWVLSQILHLLNPIMPFITETLWKEFSNDCQMLLTTPWPTYDSGLKDPTIAAEMDWVVHLISIIRSIRVEMNVPAAIRIPCLLKDASPVIIGRLEAHGSLIKQLARLSELTAITGDSPRDSVQSVLDESILVLPLGEIINLDQERLRIQRELDKVAENIENVNRKLTNGQFLAKAPETVVEQQKEKLVQYMSVREKLSKALARIQGSTANDSWKGV
jgi:valyl-tRNA synthetase